MKARVHISLQNGVLDPEAKAVHHALVALKFTEVQTVKMSKLIELELDAEDEAGARARVNTMCETLLANGVIETWSIDFSE